MTRAALYARVSTDDQVEKYGLPAQLRELHALAERKGYEVLGKFIDEGHSGATLDRPQLTRLREVVRAGAVDVVLILDPDRLARDLYLQLLLDREMDKAKVRVEYVTVAFEATPAGTMFRQFKGAIAQYERAVISERTQRGRVEKALRGQVEKALRGQVACGPYAFGYRPDPKSPCGVVVHEGEAATVRLIFRLFVEERLGARSVSEEMRRLGVAPPRSTRWDRRTIRRILTTRTYLGEWIYTPAKGAPIVVPVPAIVTPELVERARQQLARNRSVLVGRTSPFVYLLRGLLRCGACGHRWAGSAWEHAERYRVYRCNGRDRIYRPPCAVPTIKADRLEGRVWEAVAGILRDPSLLVSKLHDQRSRLGVREVEVRSEAEYLARQLADLDRQTERLLDLYQRDGGSLGNDLRGIIPLRTYLRRKAPEGGPWPSISGTSWGESRTSFRSLEDSRNLSIRLFDG
jgi:site-specific DNA recombinase